MYKHDKLEKRKDNYEDLYTLLRLNFTYIILQQTEEQLRLKVLIHSSEKQPTDLKLDSSLLSEEKLFNQVFLEKFRLKCKIIEGKISKIIRSLSVWNMKSLIDLQDDINRSSIVLEEASIKDIKIVDESASAQQLIEQKINNLEMNLYDLNNLANLEFGKVADELLSNNVKWHYFLSWENAKFDQKQYYYHKIENDLNEKIEKYQQLYINESKFMSQLEAIQDAINYYIAEIEIYSQLYDDKMDALDMETNIRMNNLEAKKNEYTNLLLRYDQHKQWLKETIENDSAIIIQKWWAEKVIEVRIKNMPPPSKKDKKGKKNAKEKKKK